ncbi:glycosyltransferase family 2 protein [Calothrix sp. 336/3]|uniref:glycosyltransferase family 2 protein n=1 Tax=Calothrix sp. 336/3 TaxID=1337936 RepID=UPI0004E2C01A|nr:glycosyltransferase family 2 protein [Calothrix sp. 336/3]AKG22276.1 glycosyl transferase family 2 [Calothrix sp. 336/3]
MSYRIAAYITAYQEASSVHHTVKALQQQLYPVKQILIVDNSPQPVINQEEFPNLIVKHHPENIGVAGGLNIAINWAIAAGYDFLWLFDQDSQPDEYLLAKLVRQYLELSHQQKNIGIIAPKILDIHTQQEFPGSIFKKYKFVFSPEFATTQDYYECDGVITSGSLVNLKAAQSVDLPRGDLFLDAVDYAYCMNLRRKGYDIVVVRNAEMKHRLGNYTAVTDRFHPGSPNIFTFVCSPSRYYYACRNHTFFETRLTSNQNMYLSILYRIKCARNMIERIIRYESDMVFLKIWACIRGTFDGFCGRLGKTW